MYITYEWTHVFYQLKEVGELDENTGTGAQGSQWKVVK